MLVKHHFGIEKDSTLSIHVDDGISDKDIILQPMLKGLIMDMVAIMDGLAVTTCFYYAQDGGLIKTNAILMVHSRIEMKGISIIA